MSMNTDAPHKKIPTDDQVQQLTDLGLESKAFRGHFLSKRRENDEREGDLNTMACTYESWKILDLDGCRVDGES